MSGTQHCFRGAAVRLRLLHGEPVLTLTRPPVEPTLNVIGRPGETIVHVSIPPGETWPDPLSAALAAGALAQDGAVAVTFADLGDALACLRRIGQDNRAAAPAGAA